MAALCGVQGGDENRHIRREALLELARDLATARRQYDPHRPPILWIAPPRNQLSPLGAGDKAGNGGFCELEADREHFHLRLTVAKNPQQAKLGRGQVAVRGNSIQHCLHQQGQLDWRVKWADAGWSALTAWWLGASVVSHGERF